MPKKYFKIIGSALLLIPTSFLLLFLLGETLGGDLSGLIHLVQLLPLLLLLFVSWKWPRAGGVFLVGIGTIFGLLYIITGNFMIQTVIFIELIIFIPLVLSGIFLLLSKSDIK